MRTNYDAVSRPLLEARFGSSAAAISASWVLETGPTCGTAVADAPERHSIQSPLGD
ncbi:hypothetical protein [Natronorubrum sp. DTA7]|uniref:hypothetical protein n=1 Tax=Natronorubrum sp. DTA7 TaxID=3447016 RepID=UPI003F85DA5D